MVTQVSHQRPALEPVERHGRIGAGECDRLTAFSRRSRPRPGVLPPPWPRSSVRWWARGRPSASSSGTGVAWARPTGSERCGYGRSRSCAGSSGPRRARRGPGLRRRRISPSRATSTRCCGSCTIRRRGSSVAWGCERCPPWSAPPAGWGHSDHRCPPPPRSAGRREGCTRPRVMPRRQPPLRRRQRVLRAGARPSMTTRVPDSSPRRPRWRRPIGPSTS